MQQETGDASQDHKHHRSEVGEDIPSGRSIQRAKDDGDDGGENADRREYPKPDVGEVRASVVEYTAGHRRQAA